MSFKILLLMLLLSSSVVAQRPRGTTIIGSVTTTSSTCDDNGCNFGMKVKEGRFEYELGISSTRLSLLLGRPVRNHDEFNALVSNRRVEVTLRNVIVHPAYVVHNGNQSAIQPASTSA